MRKRTIHFEQIPVALVKKIAEADVPKNQDTGCDNRIAKVPARGMNPYGVRDVHLEERALDMEDSSGNDDPKYPGGKSLSWKQCLSSMRTNPKHGWPLQK